MSRPKSIISRYELHVLISRKLGDSFIFSSSFSASLQLPEMIIFSIALVSATYNTLSSSPIRSTLSLCFITFCFIELSFILFLLSTYCTPNPKSVSITIPCLKSVLLNFLCAHARKHTGNSSPFDLCMVMILTISSFSERILASPKSLSKSFSLAIYLIKL